MILMRTRSLLKLSSGSNADLNNSLREVNMKYDIYVCSQGFIKELTDLRLLEVKTQSLGCLERALFTLFLPL